MTNSNSPRKLPRQQRAQITVNAILDATAHILVASGYAKTTTNAVAERAGVSIGSLYQYFPNKDSLINALYQRHKARMQAIVFKAIQAPIQLHDNQSLFLMIDAIVQAHLIEPELHARFDEIKSIEGLSEIKDDDMQGIQNWLEKLLSEQIQPLIEHNYKLMALMLAHTVHALVHAIAFESAPEHDKQAMIQEVVLVIKGYLNNYTK